MVRERVSSIGWEVDTNAQTCTHMHPPYTRTQTGPGSAGGTGGAHTRTHTHTHTHAHPPTHTAQARERAARAAERRARAAGEDGVELVMPACVWGSGGVVDVELVAMAHPPTHQHTHLHSHTQLHTRQVGEVTGDPPVPKQEL